MAKDKKFKYRGRDRSTEDVVRRSRQSGGMYDSYLKNEVQMFKPKEGENTIRILPPTWDDIDKWGDGWEVNTYIHYNVGPDNATYLCLDKMLGEPCPVCEARRVASDEEEANALRPGWRPICWIVDRENQKAGVQAWPMPATMFREINARSVDKKTNAVILVDDPEEGYDISFIREGSKLKTKYTSVEVSRDPTPLHEKDSIYDRWIDYIQDNPLPEQLHFYDAEYIEKVLLGRKKSAPEDEQEEEEEETSGRRSSTRRRGRRDEEEEQNETGEDEPAEEEEEVRPSRRRARREEPEEEPEEEETRSTRRRSRKEEPEEEPDDDEDTRPSRRRSRREEPEEEPDEEETSPRRSRRQESEEEEPDEEEETSSGSARRQLGRLQRRGRSE